MESGAIVLLIISVVYYALNKRWSRAPTEKQLAFVHACCREKGVRPPENMDDFDAVRDWLDEHGYYIGARKIAERKQFIAIQGIILGSTMLAAVKSGGIAAMVVIAFWLVWTVRITATKSMWLAVIQSATIIFAMDAVRKPIMATLQDAMEAISVHNVAITIAVSVLIFVACVVVVLRFWKDMYAKADRFHKLVKRDGLIKAVRKYISDEMKI